ncbi:LPXTG cell wall anchor domain-containing protein [Flavobacterium sp. FPG59]|jgi:LPXTG-motif cell wall-anchored protein|uniref:LPXTG cell wall anchor domain-containing protein n=1 Tax=Flavobacterium sp. FPG59 TaxID=1929267 RepID=UPI00112008BA|nr:LPXTG cell wall anchor domain-containing protein [Flavobacterium sp. FPG59]
MKINWTILIGLAIAILVLIYFLIRKNNKDKEDYTNFLNQDFKKQEEQESDLNDESY